MTTGGKIAKKLLGKLRKEVKNKECCIFQQCVQQAYFRIVWIVHAFFKYCAAIVYDQYVRIVGYKLVDRRIKNYHAFNSF